MNRTYQHPFHLLSFSFLPLCTSIVVGSLALLLITKLHNISSFCRFDIIASFLTNDLFDIKGLGLDYSTVIKPLNLAMFIFFGLLLSILWAWANELIKEAHVFGFHTKPVQSGLLYGMTLFLLSEAMLFFPFFWAFFHASLSPSIAVGAIWPPVGIEALDPFMLPLANTVILLTSGVTLVSAHRAITVEGYNGVLINGLFLSIVLGILFSWLQYIEYGLTSYTINDTTFGSAFLMLTGLHGFHVLVGTCLLLVAYIRSIHMQFSTKHHISSECAAWYWHFVDVVWLFLFIFVYVWGK